VVEKVWLIAKKGGKAEAFWMAEQDVEGYVNSLRNCGFESFEVAKPEYGINDAGRYEI
jgi:phosphosulfolactate synthase (CoM biosynthesis protein A)